MMPTIRVDNEIWSYLKKKAEPFEDTPNTVLRRLLRLEKSSRRGRRLPAGSRTPQDAYRLPILEAVGELGGKGGVQDVLRLVEKKMESRLNAIDRQKISTGMRRWRNAAMWERKAMVDEGLLLGESPRGIWEISPQGRELLRKRA